MGMGQNLADIRYHKIIFKSLVEYGGMKVHFPTISNFTRTLTS